MPELVILLNRCWTWDTCALCGEGVDVLPGRGYTCGTAVNRSVWTVPAYMLLNWCGCSVAATS